VQAAGGAALIEEQPSAVTDDSAQERPTPPRRIALLLAVAAVVFAADVVTKVLAVAYFGDGTQLRLFGGLLVLRETRNPGAAFGIAGGATVLFTLVAVVVVVAIVRRARRLRNAPWALTLGLLLGGASGNLLDRLARTPGPLRGHVVDWIELPHWPVFNLADAAIVTGGVLAVLLASRGLQVDGTRTTS
jgi:signal peptidase II